MIGKYIPVEESFRNWEKDSEFRAAYRALEAQVMAHADGPGLEALNRLLRQPEGDGAA